MDDKLDTASFDELIWNDIKNNEPIFWIVMGFSIVMVCASVLLLCRLLQTNYQRNIKFIYKLFIFGSIFDVITCIYNSLWILVDAYLLSNQSDPNIAVYFYILTMIIPLNLLIFQIFTVMLILIQMQKLFSVLDRWLELLIKPSKIILFSLTTLTALIIIIPFIFIITDYLEFYDLFLLLIYLVFMALGSVSIIVALFSLYLIRIRLQRLHYQIKNRIQTELDQKVSKTISEIQYIILLFAFVALLLIGLIIPLYIQGTYAIGQAFYLNESLVIDATFLALLRILFYILFEKCKTVALFKPIQNYTTNLHDNQVRKSKIEMLIKKNTHLNQDKDNREIQTKRVDIERDTVLLK